LDSIPVAALLLLCCGAAMKVITIVIDGFLRLPKRFLPLYAKLVKKLTSRPFVAWSL
jgi:hypothetical protein